MAVDPYDPWDDPSTLPSPGAYDYRRTGSVYDYTPADASAVGLTAAAYPWMSPGVAAAVGRAGVGIEPEVADLSLQQSVQETPVAPGSKRRARQTRRQLKAARWEIKDSASSLRDYGNDQWSPSTPGQQEWLKQLGVYGTGLGKEKDRAKALEVANQIESALQADERTQIRLGKQLQKLADGTANNTGGGIGDFLASPLIGASATLGAVTEGIKAGNKFASNAVGNPQPPIPGSRPVVRNAAIAAQFPQDLFNASVRDFAYDISQSPETLGVLAENNSAGVAQNVQNLLEQTYAYQAWVKGKATGSGFLPSYDTEVDGKESAAAAAGKAARRLYPEIVIDDHAWTPGRQLADLVVDPDSMAFATLSGLVDGVIALKADPTNAALDSIATARAKPILVATEDGANAYKAAGAIDGFRKQTNVVTARSWLLTDGFPVVKAYKDMAQRYAAGKIGFADAVDIANRAFDEIPLSVHKKLISLGDAPDSEFVAELRKLLGTEIREPLNTNRIVGGRFMLGSKSKMWATLPPNYVDLSDPDEAIRSINAAGKMLDAPEATVAGLRKMIIESSGSPAQNEAIARATMGMYQEAFKAAGTSEGFAKSLTQLVADRMESARVYDVDENGLAAHFPFMQVDGVGVPLPDPALVTEMRNSAFELPDMRMAKRIVSGLGEFLNFDPNDLTGLGSPDTSRAFKAMESSIDVMDHAMGVWRQLVLTRPAWGLRVIAEEQLRMAAAGSVSFFRSPLSALAWVLGNPGDADVAKRLKAAAAGAGAVIGGIYGAQQDGLEGAVLGAAAGGAGGYALASSRAQDLTEAFNRAKTKYGRGVSGIGGSSFYSTTDFDEYQQALYGGFRNLEPSQAAKLRTHLFGTVSNTDPRAAQAYAEELVRVGSDPVVRKILDTGDLKAVKDAFWSGDLAAQRKFLAEAPDRPGAVRQWREMTRDRQLADSYIDYVAGRIERVTNNNPDFVQVMRTGMWGDKPIAYRFKNGGVVANGEVFGDQAWVDAVNTQAPNKIRAEHTLTRSDAEKKVSLRRARNLLDTVFDALMPRPSNYLSRSPEFRQRYWQRVEELFPELGTEARAAVLADAKRANLGSAALARYEAMDRYLAGVEETRRAEALAKAVDVPGEATLALRDEWGVRGRPAAPNLPELFHGTFRRLQDDRAIPGASESILNLMGPGFYATDSLDVASSYRKKGSTILPGVAAGDGSPTVYSVEWVGTRAPKVLDAEAPAAAALKDTLRDYATRVLSETGTDESYAKVLDAIDNGSVADVIDAVRKHLVADGQTYKIDADYSFQEFQLDTFGKHADVLRYDGGVRTRGTPHSAYVFIDEENIKLHVVDRNLGWSTSSSTAPKTIVPPSRRVGAGLAAKDADTIAKRYALDQVKSLLYDLSEKSHFFDATRLIFPFGEAWKEIITRWAQLLAEHPNYIRRAQQGIQAARQMKVDPVTGLPDPGGIGMWHKDLTTGQESFIYPMTGLISDKLLGVPIPLVGSVQGLNLVGTGLPGIGPVVQFPLAAILPDTPRYDTVRDILFPYGEPSGDGVVDVAAGTLLPAWMKKIDQAFSSPNVERLQGNVVAAVMQYKLSTGEYEVNGPDAQDEIKRLFKDSKAAATKFMVIRGLAQAITPTAPSPQFLVKHGPNLVIATKIAEDYRKRAQKVGWDQAFEWLLDTYGPDTALLLAQPRSEAKVPGLTATSDQVMWERKNPDLVTRYPDVWTMFAPNSGDFDIAAYTQEFKRNQREALTPEEIVHKANDRLARHVYNRQQEALEADGKLTDAEEAQLKAFRQQLLVDFPGYDPYTFQNRTPVILAQLRDAVKDPALARTAAGSAITKYFQARDAAEAQAKARNVALFGTSAKGKAIRDQLYAYGEALRTSAPDFRTVWNEVFVYEFKDR